MEALHRNNLEGDELMSLVFNRLAKSITADAITASSVMVEIHLADYPAFLGNHSAGDYFYCALRDASNLEIIKVNITGSSVDDGLSIDRGQQGTSSRAWPANTLIYQDISATDLENLEQQGVFRTTASNPNGVLSPNYAGEKVLQTGSNLWWKSVDAVSTVWKLIAGEQNQYAFVDSVDTSSNDGYGIWSDGTYVYLAAGANGLIAYELSGGTLSQVGIIDDGGVYRGVWGDGTYIYTACGGSGLRAYTFNGSAFTLIDTIYDGSDWAYNVWGDGTYIYVAHGLGGLRAYTFNGTSFTNVGSIDDAPSNAITFDVYGDGTYIFTASGWGGLRAYTFNGSIFTHQGTIGEDDGAPYEYYPRSVTGDGTYIFISDDYTGLGAYSFNGSVFTEIDTNTILQRQATTGGCVWYDNGFLHTGNDDSPPLLTAFTFDGSNLTQVDQATVGGDGECMAIWSNATHVFVAAETSGIRVYSFG